jgi:hypothetical protein
MGLYLSAKVSFIFNLCLLELYVYMRNRSSEFNDWPFYSVFSNSNVWSVVQYVFPLSSICSAYFEFCLFLCLVYVLYIGFYIYVLFVVRI